jgi:alternative ribosome-rescue factor
MNMSNKSSIETGRGQVKHNHLAALVTSKVYRQQIVKAKKGKGAYIRKDKRSDKQDYKKGQEPYLIAV